MQWVMGKSLLWKSTRVPVGRGCPAVPGPALSSGTSAVESGSVLVKLDYCLISQSSRDTGMLLLKYVISSQLLM